MAKLSSDGKFVTVEKGDTLSQIAVSYGKGATYQQLAAINNIANPDLIYIGQKIYLTKESAPSTSSTNNSNKPKISHFGLQSNADNTLFATWTWNKSNTESYKALWTYDTGDGVWFQGSNSVINVDEDAPNLAKMSTYSIPSNAKRVQFKVKPISKTYKKDDKDVHYWEASWSDVKTHTIAQIPGTPSTPSVTIEKYKLTATLDNLTVDATGIEFQIIKNNSASVFKTGKANIVTGHASYACNIDAGAEYKVRCRAYKGSSYGEWSQYSNNVGTIPATPVEIVTIQAKSESSVYLGWHAVPTATGYDIEYATDNRDFDHTDNTTTVSVEGHNGFRVDGLESGRKYFFRIRAVNNIGVSGWSLVKNITIGKPPAAPTTWSSTTTAITGEPLTLYWVHNSEDDSSQTFAELELDINGVIETYDVKNSTDEEEKDKTSFYDIDTSVYVEGTKIKWRVRTAGVTKEYGDWSVQRTIDIYAPATLDLSLTNLAGTDIGSCVTELPFYLKCLAGPNTQIPIGYHVVITSNDMYETTDNKGNTKIVNVGESVYSKYFDATGQVAVEFSANNVSLENNIRYTLTCTTAMDSGLTAESSVEFYVMWSDVEYFPNAEIGVDKDTLTASIRPYCRKYGTTYHKVEYSARKYIVTSEIIDSVYGNPIRGAETTTGEQVYSGTTADGDFVNYCQIEEYTDITDVLLSVYRREFDGSLTELIVNLDGSKATTITDPHPALDFARYRIVATSKTTGSVSYYDPPGYPIGGTAVIIQWDEEWTPFESSEESALEHPAWAGSMVKLPYNIDMSDSNRLDVVLVEYVGRSHPVSYYGTQVGEKTTWMTEIDKNDKETLYSLRRLAKWMGDVYVREPSGSGYWASISVSFSQKHRSVTIPVTFDITRVEGGM